MSVAGNIWVLWVLPNKIQTHWNESAHENGFVKAQPALQCIMKCLFSDIGRPTRLMMLQCGPVRLKGFDEPIYGSFAAELSLQIGDQHFQFVLEQWSRNSASRLENSGASEQTEGDVLKVPGDPLDDVADDVRYGIYTFITSAEKPRETASSSRLLKNL
jgi:hypothetical protein